MAEFKEELVINALHTDKAEVGKKYWYSNKITELKREVETNGNVKTLVSIKNQAECFNFDTNPSICTTWSLIYPYEEPQCRPYENANEMIEDFCQRARLEATSMLMPTIWIKEKGVNTKRLIVSFVGDCVYTHFGTNFDNWSLSELFDNFTYLDGSPIGIGVDK